MTPGFLGGFALLATLLLSVIGLGFCFLTYSQRDGRYLEAARRTATLAFLGAVLSFVALEWALLTHDFSVRYVALHHSVNDPRWVTLVTPWAALEGSILLWGTLQTLYTFLVGLRAGRSLDVWRAPVALGVLFAVQVFFFAVMVFIAHPFDAVPNPPPDGRGPNPLLQNHWMMAIHPVLMYLGFVGLSVPFAYAVSAMVVRRYQSWVYDTRWWTLVAWGFLTAAIYAGGWWSYEVLGWGGYWAWDPVENASIIPWFLATAFLHVAQVQERRGLFKSWNFAFIVLAFAGTVLGTFLTRSGVIQSVHAFGEGPVGAWFLAFLLTVLLVGFGLLSRVSGELREAGEVRWRTREGMLLAGSLLFGTFAIVVVLGTLWPLLVEAVRGAKVSIGAPFFNQVSGPLGAILLLLMGIGPVLPWRNTQGQVQRNLTIMLVGLVVGTVFGLVMGWTFGVSLAVGLFVYNIVAVWLMVAQGVGERSKSLGISPIQAFTQIAATNKRRFGSHIVHVGVALSCLAIAFSMAYRSESQKTLNIGEVWEQGSMRVALQNIVEKPESNRIAVEAKLEVRSTNRSAWGVDGSYKPRINLYLAMGQPLPMPSVKYSLLNDFYFVLMQHDEENFRWATIKVIITPMVLWLWLGGLLIVLGTVYILWPVGAAVSSKRMVPSS